MIVILSSAFLNKLDPLKIRLAMGRVSSSKYTFIYTETIKLCPLDVYVCQFLTYERISFIFFTLQTDII